MLQFVRKSIKGERVSCFNQYYKSGIPDTVSKITSEELGVKGGIHNIIETCLDCKNKY